MTDRVVSMPVRRRLQYIFNTCLQAGFRIFFKAETHGNLICLAEPDPIHLSQKIRVLVNDGSCFFSKSVVNFNTIGRRNPGSGKEYHGILHFFFLHHFPMDTGSFYFANPFNRH